MKRQKIFAKFILISLTVYEVFYKDLLLKKNRFTHDAKVTKSATKRQPSE